MTKQRGLGQLNGHLCSLVRSRLLPPLPPPWAAAPLAARRLADEFVYPARQESERLLLLRLPCCRRSAQRRRRAQFEGHFISAPVDHLPLEFASHLSAKSARERVLLQQVAAPPTTRRGNCVRLTRANQLFANTFGRRANEASRASRSLSCGQSIVKKERERERESKKRARQGETFCLELAATETHSRPEKRSKRAKAKAKFAAKEELNKWHRPAAGRSQCQTRPASLQRESKSAQD